MSYIKNYYHDYLSAEDFDLMFDDEYELWLQEQAEKAAYEEALAWGK